MNQIKITTQQELFGFLSFFLSPSTSSNLVHIILFYSIYDGFYVAKKKRKEKKAQTWYRLYI